MWVKPIWVQHCNKQQSIVVIAIVLASLADVIKSQTIMIQIFLDTLSRKKERRRTTGMEKQQRSWTDTSKYIFWISYLIENMGNTYQCCMLKSAAGREICLQWNFYSKTFFFRISFSKYKSVHPASNNHCHLWISIPCFTNNFKRAGYIGLYCWLLHTCDSMME